MLTFLSMQNFVKISHAVQELYAFLLTDNGRTDSHCDYSANLRVVQSTLIINLLSNLLMVLSRLGGARLKSRRLSNKITQSVANVHSMGFFWSLNLNSPTVVHLKARWLQLCWKGVFSLLHVHWNTFHFFTFEEGNDLLFQLGHIHIDCCLLILTYTDSPLICYILTLV